MGSWGNLACLVIVRQVGCCSVALEIIVLAIRIINNSNNFCCERPRLDRQISSLLLTGVGRSRACISIRLVWPQGDTQKQLLQGAPAPCLYVLIAPHAVWSLEAAAAALVGLGSPDRCPEQPSSCWRHAAHSSYPADCCQPREGLPWLDDDLSAQCLMAQAAWLAQRAPSISLETRSLGTGIDATGSLNINASLGSGKRSEEGGREAVVMGRTSSHWHTRPGGTCLGWGTWPWGSTKHSGFSPRQEKLRRGKNRGVGKTNRPRSPASTQPWC